MLAGGHADGNLIAPTVLNGVTQEMRIYSEESFGPVVVIAAVDGAEEAIQAANDTEYGLSASVFATDVDHALEIARRIQSGICHVNSSTVHDEPQMPFGGRQGIGVGSLRRQSSARGVHRAALDDDPADPAALPDLKPRSQVRRSRARLPIDRRGSLDCEGIGHGVRRGAGSRT